MNFECYSSNCLSLAELAAMREKEQLSEDYLVASDLAG